MLIELLLLLSLLLFIVSNISTTITSIVSTSICLIIYHNKIIGIEIMIFEIMISDRCYYENGDYYDNYDDSQDYDYY